MNETRESDRSTDPLLIKIRDCDDINDDVKKSLGGKWSEHGLVRNKRSCDETSFNVSFGALNNNKKRLVVFAALIVLLIYVNSSAVSWNDERSSERITVNHHSHVPGMKARALKIINVTSSTTTTTRVSAPSSKPLINQSLKQIPPSGYLVWSDQCKMPNLDPYSSDVMRYFKRQKYESCTTVQPLTRVTYNAERKRYTLHVDNKLKSHYAESGPVTCCYQLVQRSGKDKRADEEFSLDKCRFINGTQEELARKYENILVKCWSLEKDVYVNAHAMIPERRPIRKRMDDWKAKMPENFRPASVLMVGIDSVSRQNFIRAMPKTAQFVYDSEWFEMSGYNKIEDNTFPNLMAIFTGYNLSTAHIKCNPYVVGQLDKCPMIWNYFNHSGYVTAYAEDEETISTFNYLKVGFEKTPTDYYLRPLMIAAEAYLPVKKKSSLTFCLGFKHSAEYVYDYIIDMATTYKNDPYFGVFWANTFSHNAISDASSMDERMREYLEKFREIGVYENSIVIFFSDHGMRFGPTRQLPSGRIEERLPFFFIWLPDWFKKRYPEYVNALNINKNRLTTPYDVHMTLKHILELSGRASNLPRALDCPKCQSLFVPVPHNRSCADAAIEEHWCTCTPYELVDSDNEAVRRAANFTVEYINDYLKNYKNGTVTKSCAKLRLSRIKYAYYADLVQGHVDAFQIAFETKPGDAMFESTVHFDLENRKFALTGSVSRLNSYASMSKCVNEGVLQKFCYCK